MFEGLVTIGAQLRAFWGSLAPAQRIAFASIALISLSVMLLLINFAQRTEYSTLYANLAPDDASAVVDELTTRGVPYKLVQAGTAVQVPTTQVYDLRLELASKPRRFSPI